MYSHNRKIRCARVTTRCFLRLTSRQIRVQSFKFFAGGRKNVISTFLVGFFYNSLVASRVIAYEKYNNI